MSKNKIYFCEKVWKYFKENNISDTTHIAISLISRWGMINKIRYKLYCNSDNIPIHQYFEDTNHVIYKYIFFRLPMRSFCIKTTFVNTFTLNIVGSC